MKQGKTRNGSATIRDVARVADVSIGTVSRYLNGYVLREKNRKRIDDAIIELGFKENLIAKGLKNRRTMTIGVVIDHLTDIFMTTVVSAVESWFEERGYSVIICDYHGNEQKLNRKLRFLQDRYIDGLILFPYGECQHELHEYEAAGIPMVIVNDDLSGVAADKVQVDNRHASSQAVKYLHTCGHERIAIIAGREDSFTSNERVAGYLQAHKDLGLEVDTQRMLLGGFTEQGGYDAMVRILRELTDTTAVFSCSYAMTMGMLIAANDLSVVIPDDISIITFDNFEMFKIVKPALSVIEQPLWLMGEYAASVLFRRINGDIEDHPATKIFPTTFLQRASVKTL
jgi:LacI family transcriptional regulator